MCRTSAEGKTKAAICWLWLQRSPAATAVWKLCTAAPSSIRSTTSGASWIYAAGAVWSAATTAAVTAKFAKPHHLAGSEWSAEPSQSNESRADTRLRHSADGWIWYGTSERLVPARPSTAASAWCTAWCSGWSGEHAGYFGKIGKLWEAVIIFTALVCFNFVQMKGQQGRACMSMTSNFEGGMLPFKSLGEKW